MTTERCLQRPCRLTLLLGLLAGGLLLPVPGPAMAQTLRGVVLEGPLPPMRPTAPPQRSTDPSLNADATTADAQARPPTLRRALPEDAEPLSATGAPPDATVEEAAPQAPDGTRAAIRDGEPDVETGEPPAIPDGVPDPVGEDYQNPDGADAVTWDSRPDADRQPFDTPPAGHDPEAFATELSGLSDRRPTRLQRFQPWEPRGIPIGSFIVFPVIDVGGVWTSNLFRSPAARADRALELRPGARVRSNWRNHALEASAGGNLTYFDQNPGENDRGYELEARGRLDITRRTQLSAQIRREVAQETRGTLDSRLRGGARDDVTSDEQRLTLAHRFNRLQVELRAGRQTRTFDAPPDTAASIAVRDRDVTIDDGAVRASWTFKPTLITFAETAVDRREFQVAAGSDGISRNSSGERYRLGIGFGNTSQLLRGEASLGYGRQMPDDARLSTIDGMLIDANIGWRIDALNALLLRASTDITDTTAATSAGGLTRRASIEFRHAFLRPLIGTAGLAHSATSYKGIDLTERQTDATLGLEYYLGPEAVIYGRWQHSMYRTTAANADWQADEFKLGIRLRR